MPGQRSPWFKACFYNLLLVLPRLQARTEDGRPPMLSCRCPQAPECVGEPMRCWVRFVADGTCGGAVLECEVELHSRPGPPATWGISVVGSGLTTQAKHPFGLPIHFQASSSGKGEGKGRASAIMRARRLFVVVFSCLLGDTAPAADKGRSPLLPPRTVPTLALLWPESPPASRSGALPFFAAPRLGVLWLGSLCLQRPDAPSTPSLERWRRSTSSTTAADLRMLPQRSQCLFSNSAAARASSTIRPPGSRDGCPLG